MPASVLLALYAPFCSTTGLSGLYCAPRHCLLLPIITTSVEHACQCAFGAVCAILLDDRPLWSLLHTSPSFTMGYALYPIVYLLATHLYTTLTIWTIPLCHRSNFPSKYNISLSLL